jgi:hypothetical protein
LNGLFHPRSYAVCRLEAQEVISPGYFGEGMPDVAFADRPVDRLNGVHCGVAGTQCFLDNGKQLV